MFVGKCSGSMGTLRSLSNIASTTNSNVILQTFPRGAMIIVPMVTGVGRQRKKTPVVGRVLLLLLNGFKSINYVNHDALIENELNISMWNMTCAWTWWVQWWRQKKISQQFDQATSGSWYSQDVLCGCVSRTGTALNQRGHPGSQERLGFPDGALYLRCFGRFLSRQPTRLPCTTGFWAHLVLTATCKYLSEMKCQIISDIWDEMLSYFWKDSLEKVPTILHPLKRCL